MNKKICKTSPHSSELMKNIRQELGKIWLVDAHEHLPSEEDWLADPENSDFTSLLGYVRWNLVSAGMQKDALSPGISPEEKWKRISPYWQYVKNMGEASLLRRVLSMFFDVDDLNKSTIPIIQTKLSELTKPGIYGQLFQDTYNIEVCVNISEKSMEALTLEPSSHLFLPLLYTNHLAMIQKRSDVHMLETASNQEIYSLKTYLQAIDTILEKALKNGFAGIKWHKLGWIRDIYYPVEDAHTAETCLNRILMMPARPGLVSDTPVGFDEMKPFQNYMQHYLIQKSIELDFPVQIHTGIPGGSYGGQITYNKPTHLVNLFLKYPQARFDLLHVSYPYMRELTALVKLFPNVYINTAWFELLSPRATKQYLREWISSIPINKIFGFGGDQFNVLLSCAYAELVKDNLAEILSAEVTEGNMSEERSLEIGKCLLRKNAWEYFKIEERWKRRHKKPKK